MPDASDVSGALAACPVPRRRLRGIGDPVTARFRTGRSDPGRRPRRGYCRRSGPGGVTVLWCVAFSLIRDSRSSGSAATGSLRLPRVDSSPFSILSSIVSSSSRSRPASIPKSYLSGSSPISRWCFWLRISSSTYLWFSLAYSLIAPVSSFMRIRTVFSRPMYLCMKMSRSSCDQLPVSECLRRTCRSAVSSSQTLHGMSSGKDGRANWSPSRGNPSLRSIARMTRRLPSKTM